MQDRPCCYRGIKDTAARRMQSVSASQNCIHRIPSASMSGVNPCDLLGGSVSGDAERFWPLKNAEASLGWH
jgi:hypothetical protein